MKKRTTARDVGWPCMGQGPAVWVALLGLPPTVVAAVTLTTNRGLTYCAISLAGILVAVLVSLSMRQAQAQYAVVAGFIIRVLVTALSSWMLGYNRRSFICEEAMRRTTTHGHRSLSRQDKWVLGGRPFLSVMWLQAYIDLRP